MSRSGTRCFHLNLIDGDTDQHFELGRDIIPSPDSELEFFQAFRFVGNGTRLQAEILPEGGSWKTLWSRAGICGSCGTHDWDTAWNRVAVPLGDYAGQVVSIRFRYVYTDGDQWWAYLPGHNPAEYGALIDDIRVTPSLTLTNPVTAQISANTSKLTFTPKRSVTTCYRLGPSLEIRRSPSAQHYQSLSASLRRSIQVHRRFVA